MENKINVAELLCNCPNGMELDCVLSDRVELDGVDMNCNYPIRILVGGKCLVYLTAEGYLSSIAFGTKGSKCIIFPKGKTTWEGFVPPCKFKDGDIIFTHSGNYSWISIFKQFSGKSCCTYVDLCINDNDLITSMPRYLCNIEEINTQRLATEEEKKKLFATIKDNGYKWNTKTKTLDKLPKFKAGDRIKHKTHIKQENVVTKIKDTYYILDDKSALSFTFQDEYELVPDKFDITTLKPFDKVLTRVTTGDVWGTDLFGYYKNGLFHCNGHTAFNYCIPFVGNEHLLGTTDDCDKYFKTWK